MKINGKEKKEKLILFEGTILSYAVKKNATRSGIYVETFELFKRFQNMNRKMIVLCDVMDAINMKKTREKYFPECNFETIYYVRWNQSFGGSGQCSQVIRSIIRICLLSFMSLPVWAMNVVTGKKKRMMDADIFFSTAYVGPASVQNNRNIKKFYCIQDAIPILFPQYFPQMQDRNYWYNCLIRSMNKNDFYFAISNSTKNDICKIVNQIEPEQVTVTYLGKNERYCCMDMVDEKILNKYGLQSDSKYYFSLCTLEPRKNLIRAVKSFISFIEKYEIDDLYFVIGGGSWKKFQASMINEFQNNSLFREKIKMIGYIPDEELPYLYNKAMCFVFTSQYEGFGLPPLEAMSCGCPVITSTSASLPEIVKDAGLTVQWDSEEEHIDAYQKIYNNEELREEMRVRGVERAKYFSWDECALKMLTKMDECVM